MTTLAGGRKVYQKLPTTGTNLAVTHNIGTHELTSVAIWRKNTNGTRTPITYSALVLVNRDQLTLTISANTGDLWIAIAA
jgi:hypothetical protein